MIHNNLFARTFQRNEENELWKADNFQHNDGTSRM